MTKSTFKDISFLGVLKWVTVHSQTEKCVEIISTPLDWKGKTFQSLPNNITGVRKKSPLPAGEWEILVKGGTFSSGGENLLRSDFNHLNLFQS